MADDTSPEEIIKQGMLSRWTRGAFKTAPKTAKANKHALKKKKKHERSHKPDKKDRWQPRRFTLYKNRLMYESKKEIDKKNKKLQDKDEHHLADEATPQHDVVSKRKTHAWWSRVSKEQKRTCFFDPVTAQVTEVQSMEEMDDATTGRFFFQIKQGYKGVHLLQADTRQERQAWVDAINRVLAFHCKGRHEHAGALSESSDEDDVSRPSYASSFNSRPGSPRSRQTDADWEDQLPTWALPDDAESDDNDENDDDQLARELAKEFMQRLQNSNMYAGSPNDSNMSMAAAAKPKNRLKHTLFELSGKKSTPDKPGIRWQYRSGESSPWEDYKKRDAQKINHYYAKRTAVVDLGKWVLDLGNMSAHSKGKSPCRSVRGMHANGTAVHAFMSPTDSHVGSSTIHKQGILNRKTDVGKYVPRFFTLTDGALQYSHGNPSSKKTQRQLKNKKHDTAWKRTMNLQRVYAVTTTLQALSQVDGRFFFEVQQPDRCMKLFATSEADRTDWLNAIAAVVEANCRRVGYTIQNTAPDTEISPVTLFEPTDLETPIIHNSSEDEDPVRTNANYGVF